MLLNTSSKARVARQFCVMAQFLGSYGERGPFVRIGPYFKERAAAVRAAMEMRRETRHVAIFDRCTRTLSHP